MRLFHVSEEEDIRVFEPRLPTREDLDPDVGLVWALDEKRLPNFLTPRNCPRVAYHVGENTTDEDREKFFSSKTVSHAIVIEHKWFSTMKNTELFLYEFESNNFILQDNVAGYYVSETAQIPIKKHRVTDLFSELADRNVEVRMVDNLWDIADAVKESTLNWSLCRMRYAQERQ